MQDDFAKKHFLACHCQKHKVEVLSELMKRLFILSSALLLISACGKSQVPPPKPLETFESVMQRAQSGDRGAQFEVGAMYHDGQGVAKDLKTAREWFEKAAAQGDERAEFNLGVMYYSAESVKQDYDAARSWFEKAAMKKNARAQFNLGVMYYRAEGVKQDWPRALLYFSEAGGQGFNEAQFNLAVMYAKGEGVEADVGKAYAWFRAADAYGNTRAADVIKQIENGLTKDELKQAEALAKELKDMIDANVASMKKNAAKTGAL